MTGSSGTRGLAQMFLLEARKHGGVSNVEADLTKEPRHGDWPHTFTVSLIHAGGGVGRYRVTVERLP